jgi:hypothetical protein
MATGDVTLFDQFLVDMGNGEHDLSSDTIKMAYISNAVTPATTTPDPRWGTSPGTNMSTDEQSGGNYAAGGVTLASFACSLSAGGVLLDYDDPAQVATNASNPTAIWHAVIYNDTNAGKRCIAAIELGGPINGVTTALQVLPNASGLATGDQV